MEHYRYAPLPGEENEIRVVELLPGALDADISILIHHVILEELEKPTAAKVSTMSVEQVRKSLPHGWTAEETYEGRFLFERQRHYGPEDPFETTWTHPEAGIELYSDKYLAEPLARPSYEALSYVWGSDALNVLAYVHKSQALHNGTEPSMATLPIRSNLESALRHLRYPTESRMLWIDAICINQSDLMERDLQVRKMRDIYALSRRVVIWLGPKGDDSAVAISTLAYLGQQKEMYDSGSTHSPGCSEPMWCFPTVTLPYSSRAWDSITALLRRPWFTRTWVIQEAKLANRHSIVQCGHDQLQLYRFHVAVETAAEKRLLPGNQLRELLDAAFDTTRPFLHTPFIITLIEMNSYQCTDLRDKIYGALGMAPASIAHGVVPDYSLPVKDVYRDLARTMIGRTHRVEILCRCDLSRRTTTGPTWSPDWSAPNQNFISMLMGSNQSSGASIANATIDTTDVLSVEGHRCGVVSTVGRRAFGTSNEILSTIREWHSEFLSRRSAPDVGSETLMDSFVKTIVMNLLRERFPNHYQYLSLSEAKNLVVSAVAGNVVNTEVSIPGPNASDDGRLLDLLRVEHQSFFTTHDGNIGVSATPPSAGDLVCVLLGCPVPMLLRPTASDKLTVVGPCYLDGLMDCESLLGPLPPMWTVEAQSDTVWTYKFQFKNADTGALTDDDPRLGPLPPEWELSGAVRSPNDPVSFVHCKRKDTGETINGDPRLLPAALQERGVHLETFSLC
ncbi:hypothetical protein LTS10_001198 [Elasticomyces elasticus]|nr:hypothetical protein LTS10_001198 [Elasticomyces elasticus]